MFINKISGPLFKIGLFFEKFGIYNFLIKNVRVKISVLFPVQQVVQSVELQNYGFAKIALCMQCHILFATIILNMNFPLKIVALLSFMTFKKIVTQYMKYKLRRG